jgi:hypothetical protein
MYARFIRKICEINEKNNIVFLIDDGLVWIFKHVYNDIKNIKIIKFSERDNLPFFDYHINITMLLKFLNVTYENLYIDYYLKNIPETTFDTSNIIDSTKKNIVINWHGNLNNCHEKYNRGMNIEKLIPLFEKFPTINWLSVQKEVSKQELDILHKYNVKDLSKLVDNNGDIYKDTLQILKKVDLVITTDTSLIHVAATADINCWLLLTVGCEWRWTKDDVSFWYPKVKLLRQNKIGYWEEVVEKIVTELNSI